MLFFMRKYLLYVGEVTYGCYCLIIFLSNINLCFALTYSPSPKLDVSIEICQINQNKAIHIIFKQIYCNTHYGFEDQFFRFMI